VLIGGCAVKAADDKKQTEKSTVTTKSKTTASKTKIKIQPNSPADTVRVFYKNRVKSVFVKQCF
jgi:hypothetical protein